MKMISGSSLLLNMVNHYNYLQGTGYQQHSDALVYLFAAHFLYVQSIFITGYLHQQFAESAWFPERF